MVAWKNLKYTYPGLTIAFNDFEAPAASQWVVLGESGQGKTTLLHLIAGLLPPTSGTILIDKTDLSTLSRSEADAFRGNNIGIVFQQNHFVKSLTVLENILLANQLAGKPSDTAFAMSLLKSLGIEDQAAKKTNSLSVGQQQRVGIARALVNKPTLILADEPTSALDDKNCALVVELLQKSAAEIGATLLVVTHDYRTNQYFDKQFTIQNHV